MLKFGVKFIIVACNTSSSVSLSTLRRRFKVPILGVITPAVRKTVELSPGGRIGIIGTRATVESRCYQRQLTRINPEIKPFARACPLFVPLAEEGWTDDQVTLEVARRYLQPLLKKNIDTLILGCTHYPLLKKMLRKVVGNKVVFVDSAKETAHQAKQILNRKKLCANHHSRPARCSFYVSDEPAVFRKVGKRFLGKTIASVRKV